MSLPKIRLERCSPLSDDVWRLDTHQAHHLVNVLRYYEGAMVEGLLPEGTGRRLLMRLEKDDEGMSLRIVEFLPLETEKLNITLLIGLLKSDQFDSVLRASAELGVSSIRPLVCERSIPRFDDREISKKLVRWQKILDEGSKVSGSVFAPSIGAPIPFGSFDWASLPPARYAALLARNTAPISTIERCEGDLVLAVGPEGDWSERESDTLLDQGFTAISLGDRVLRASTAAIVACGWFRLRCFCP